MDHPHAHYDAYGNKAAFLFHELIRQEMPDGSGRKAFKKGASIIEEGKPANGLFCILSGKVKVTRLGEGGKEQIIRLAASRDVIGYHALLTGQYYKASAVALEDTVVGFVPKKIFLDILNSNPELTMQMLQLLSMELDQSETKRVDIATKTVRERLAEILLLLSESEETRPGISLSREDLAGMVGAAKEVVIRSLTQLKEEGFIETKGRQIFILNKQGLIRVAKID